MRWLRRHGAEYLHYKAGRTERSLGRRSKETEARMAEHKAARERYRRTGERLKTMARVNRALRLNLKPALPNEHEPPIDASPRGVCDLLRLPYGFSHQDRADGHQTLANALTPLARKRGLNLLKSDA